MLSPACPAEHRHAAAPRRGVTAMESLLSVAVVSIAGTALLSALASAVMSSREVALTLIADGLADQLLAEVVAAPVPVGTPPAKPSGPRAGYTVVDHFDGWSESPPQDRLGRVLGTEGTVVGTTPTPRPAAFQADPALIARFRRSIVVEKVAPAMGAWTVTASDTPFRRVTVRVTFVEGTRARQIATSSRIVCHVAPAL
jgi:hypothetical protein